MLAQAPVRRASGPTHRPTTRGATRNGTSRSHSATSPVDGGVTATARDAHRLFADQRQWYSHDGRESTGRKALKDAHDSVSGSIARSERTRNSSRSATCHVPRTLPALLYEKRSNPCRRTANDNPPRNAPWERPTNHRSANGRSEGTASDRQGAAARRDLRNDCHLHYRSSLQSVRKAPCPLDASRLHTPGFSRDCRTCAL